MKASDLPHLHIEKITDGFTVNKIVIDRHNLVRCLKVHTFNHQADVLLAFYDHTTPYTDITHNETGSFYHISPALWPLRVRRAENDLSITPTSFEDAKIILDRAEMIH